MILVLMGVSGSGKTTLGVLLAKALNWTFLDADDFHPVANIAKMSAGQPLNDADRIPWLNTLRERLELALSREESLVLACSALKSSYRDILHPRADEPIHFVYLRGSSELIAERLAGRGGHFMNPSLLASQLATLEEPAGAFHVDISEPPEKLVALIRSHFRL
jgi:carbohydrate kinase, thermoresistant glucokinase family